MGTRGLKIVRFHRRYYIYYNHYDSYPEGLGAEIVASIPTDPDKYQNWIELMRAQYSAKQQTLDRHIYDIRDGTKPDYSLFKELMILPSELQRLDDFEVDYVYIINLDHEVLTINFSIHWRLGNIPRADDLWLNAITDSVYRDVPTISVDLCPQEHMASLALELRVPDNKIGFDLDIVTPKTYITEARKTFLTSVLANVIIKYQMTILRFGKEWSADSFPFRELVFALVSIASGQAKFHSFPAQLCDPRDCFHFRCKQNHLLKSVGWLDQTWAGEYAPLLEFGSMAHHNGKPPGTSPNGTMYWHKGVLVSLTSIVDGKAITDAVTFGIDQQRTRFQVVVISLFKVSFVEVFFNDDDKPWIEVSKQMYLSPLRVEYCVSTHPRERPEIKPGMKWQNRYHMGSDCTGNEKRLRRLFPGLAALVNFFDVAASRRAASKPSSFMPLASSFAADASPIAACKSPVTLPTELYDRILDFVDYDTWKTCLVVSPNFRHYCLKKFRLDNHTNIVAGPFVEHKGPHDKNPVLAFDFEDAQTGRVFRMRRYLHPFETKRHNWMPIIGSERKALMLDTVVQFEPV